MGSLSKSRSETKKRLSPPLHSPDTLEKTQPYPVKLMLHQEKTSQALAQEINHIIANNSVTSLMLQEIAHLLGVAFQVDCCCLVTVSSEAFCEAITANWYADQYLQMPHSGTKYSMEQVLSDLPVVQCAANPLIIEDIDTIQKSLVISCQYLPLPIKTVLAIPTRFGGHNNGVVSLIKFQHYEWNETEKQLLKAVESSCAIAFSQVVQAGLIASQQRCIEKRTQYEQLIKQLTLLNRSNLELNQMLQLVIASTAESLEADRGLLILLKYANPILRPLTKKQIPKAKATVIVEWNRASSSYSNLDQSFWLLECGLCQRIFTESGTSVIIDNYEDQGNRLPSAPLFAVEEFPAILLMPLENQGRVLGFIVLQQAEVRSWQPAELNLVDMVCAQVSNAIIQSQTLRQVQNLVDERTEQLKRSLDVQSKLYERTRHYVEQLQELNQLKDEFLSNMSDRLRYPLTNMLMSIRNLRLPDVPPDRQARYLDILEQECTKEINLINDLLTLQKLESHPDALRLETIDLNLIIQDLITSVSKQLADRGLNISLDLPSQPLKWQTEVESFDRIIRELLNNVCKYSVPDTMVHIQAAHRVNQQLDQVIIKVTNTGTGISPEDATYIFDKFRRGKGGWTPGTGLGLALVKSLVQHLNGVITLEITPLVDSDLSKISFILTLPQFSDPNQLCSEK